MAPTDDRINHTNQDTELDDALFQADRRLVDSLQHDERQRRSRSRTIMWGFLGIALLLVLLMASPLLLNHFFEKKAIGGFQMSVNNTPPLESLLQEGWRLFQTGWYDKSEETFTRAVQLDPLSDNAWNGLGWSRLNAGKSDDALIALTKCIELVPNHPGANNGLGYLYFQKRDYANAEKYWLISAPSADATWPGLAKLYLIQKRFDEALPWAEKFANSNPSDSTAAQMLAAAQAKSVSDALRKSIEPPLSGNASEKSRNGWLQLQQGNPAQAVKTFKEVLAEDPDNLAARNGLGFALLNSGEIAEAKEQFEIYLNTNPGAAGPLNGLARCLKAEGKIDDAIKVWLKMVELSPEPNAGTDGLAWAYLEKAEYKSALPYFEKLAEANPADSRTQDGLNQTRAGMQRASSTP